MNENGFEDVITRGSHFYWVSTKDTLDHGWETMVFRSDADGNVLDWSEMLCTRYRSYNEAAHGHTMVIIGFQPYVA